MPALLILLLAFSLTVGFLMSGMEAGVFALSRLRIRHLMRAGNPRARILYDYLEKPEDFLWTILVGNTIANFLVVSLGVVGLYTWLQPWPVVLALALLAGGTLFYSISELLPKMLFRLYPNQLCLWMTPPFRLVHVVLRPVVLPMAWFANTLLVWSGGRKFTGRLFGDRKELRYVLLESGQDMSSAERAMIQRVLALQNLTLRQIAVPMAQVVSAHVQTSIRDLLQICRERGVTRVPIRSAEAGSARTIGLVNLKTLLFQSELDPDRVAGDVVKPALFLDAELRLEAALKQMQRTGQRLAILVESDRTELGIVSLQDILKVIFGEVAF